MSRWTRAGKNFTGKSSVADSDSDPDPHGSAFILVRPKLPDGARGILRGKRGQASLHLGTCKDRDDASATDLFGIFFFSQMVGKSLSETRMR